MPEQPDCPSGITAGVPPRRRDIPVRRDRGRYGLRAASGRPRPLFAAVLALWLILAASAAGGAASAELVFGYSVDGAPVSSPKVVQGRKSDDEIAGFCNEVLDFLRREGYALTLQELNFDERFGVFARSLAGRAGVQCGPSSKTRGRERALVSPADGYAGEFSQPFFVTTAKLLVRKNRVDALYAHPESLRIGLLKPRASGPPVTTSLIESVFPNAIIVGLPDRAQAVRKLPLDEQDPAAIDAFASDEIMLAEMLRADIEPRQHDMYAIEPPLSGFSREEYVLVIYNLPELTGKLNAWLATPQAQAAVARHLHIERGVLGGTIFWLARGDHMRAAQSGLAWSGGLLLALLAGLAWWRRRRARPAPAAPTAPSGRAAGAAQPAEPGAAVYSAPQPPAADLDAGPGNAYAGVPEPGAAATDAMRAEASTAAELATSAPGTPVPDETAASLPKPLLTARELEVLSLAGRGLGDKMIGRELGISHKTVEAHLQKIFARLGVKSREDALDEARRRGLL
ncbi:MAG: hypothetical protein JNJ60_02310 [Rhodocyclaceae bacterium]|nr:hypothetical protein [Rhodocyclaceae bacterium]